MTDNTTTSPSSSWKPLKASHSSNRPSNPIRDIVDKLKVPPNPHKPLISLSIGDPTVFGNLKNPDNINEAVIKNLNSGKYNGYAHSCGYLDARKAIAKKFSVEDFSVTPDDVIITSGCSGAIQIAIDVLANPGQNILIPAPGFSIYQTICDHLQISTKYYKLDPNRSWEVDLAHLESLIDDNTAAMIINNPSNPCGSVYSKEHLTGIVELAEKYKIPILADEIYGGLVFEKYEFFPMASLTKTVPILSVGGLSKLHLAPGWRTGWVILFDKQGICSEIRNGLVKLSQLILGANTISQSIIEEALFNTPKSYYDGLCNTLQDNAKCIVSNLTGVQGLDIVEPGGAMYMMVGIDTSKFEDITDDQVFAKKLLEEELVLVLPGKIFKIENFVRLVICPPIDKLEEACLRIKSFCERHQKKIIEI